MKLNDLFRKIEGHKKELSRVSVTSQLIGTSTEDSEKAIVDAIDALSKMEAALYTAIKYTYTPQKYDLKTPIFRDKLLLRQNYDKATEDSLLSGALSVLVIELDKFADKTLVREYQRILRPETMQFVKLNSKYFNAHKKCVDAVEELIEARKPVKIKKVKVVEKSNKTKLVVKTEGGKKEKKKVVIKTSAKKEGAKGKTKTVAKAKSATKKK